MTPAKLVELADQKNTNVCTLLSRFRSQFAKHCGCVVEDAREHVSYMKRKVRMRNIRYILFFIEAIMLICTVVWGKTWHYWTACAAGIVVILLFELLIIDIESPHFTQGRRLNPIAVLFCTLVTFLEEVEGQPIEQWSPILGNHDMEISQKQRVTNSLRGVSHAVARNQQTNWRSETTPHEKACYITLVKWMHELIKVNPSHGAYFNEATDECPEKSGRILKMISEAGLAGVDKCCQFFN